MVVDVSARTQSPLSDGDAGQVVFGMIRRRCDGSGDEKEVMKLSTRVGDVFA